MLLFPRLRLVGEKTESMAVDGGVQPGGGSCFAAANVDTCVIYQFKNVSL